MTGVTYRLADTTDGPAVARVFRQTTRHDLPFLPELHTDDEDVVHFTDIVEKQQVMLAVADGNVVGICATTPGWLNYLYVLPEHQGRGIGTQFLDQAKGENTELRLWAFQKNQRGRQFYERQGFIVEELTDGSGNEEHEPDVRYIWHKAPVS